MLRYFIIYKPYMVLSQFSALEGKQSLANIITVPKDVYPVGRLDYDSEGLLILTNDTSLNYRLLHPTFKHEREYWVQVEGTITDRVLSKFNQGVTITVDGKEYKTQPASARSFSDTSDVPERNPPIRFRKNIPTSWISLILTEGKNRQVRRMTAKLGYPTLRLIRYRIERLCLADFTPGSIKELSRDEMYKSLFR
jgi:23S rRNA pseudouridine2457 synthase